MTWRCSSMASASWTAVKNVSSSKGLDRKLDCAGLHPPHRHRNIAMTQMRITGTCTLLSTSACWNARPSASLFDICAQAARDVLCAQGLFGCDDARDPRCRRDEPAQSNTSFRPRQKLRQRLLPSSPRIEQKSMPRPFGVKDAKTVDGESHRCQFRACPASGDGRRARDSSSTTE